MNKSTMIAITIAAATVLSLLLIGGVSDQSSAAGYTGITYETDTQDTTDPGNPIPVKLRTIGYFSDTFDRNTESVAGRIVEYWMDATNSGTVAYATWVVFFDVNTITTSHPSTEFDFFITPATIQNPTALAAADYSDIVANPTSYFTWTRLTDPGALTAGGQQGVNIWFFNKAGEITPGWNMFEIQDRATGTYISMPLYVGSYAQVTYDNNDNATATGTEQFVRYSPVGVAYWTYNDNTFTRGAGYTFCAWDTVQGDGGTHLGAHRQTLSVAGPETTTLSRTIYSKWYVQVTYDAGYTGGPAIDPQLVVAKEQFTLDAAASADTTARTQYNPAGTPATRGTTSYKLIGWSTQQSSNVSYIRLTTDTVTSSTAYYAIWGSSVSAFIPAAITSPVSMTNIVVPDANPNQLVKGAQNISAGNSYDVLEGDSPVITFTLPAGVSISSVSYTDDVYVSPNPNVLNYTSSTVSGSDTTMTYTFSPSGTTVLTIGTNGNVNVIFFGRNVTVKNSTDTVVHDGTNARADLTVSSGSSITVTPNGNYRFSLLETTIPGSCIITPPTAPSTVWTISGIGADTTITVIDKPAYDISVTVSDTNLVEVSMVNNVFTGGSAQLVIKIIEPCTFTLHEGDSSTGTALTTGGDATNFKVQKIASNRYSVYDINGTAQLYVNATSAGNYYKDLYVKSVRDQGAYGSYVDCVATSNTDVGLPDGTITIFGSYIRTMTLFNATYTASGQFSYGNASNTYDVVGSPDAVEHSFSFTTYKVKSAWVQYDYTVNGSAHMALSNQIMAMTMKNVTVVTNGNGTANGTGSYYVGSEAVIEAIPNIGYVFDKWVETNDTHRVRNVSVFDDSTHTAQFTAIAAGNVVTMNFTDSTDVIHDRNNVEVAPLRGHVGDTIEYSFDATNHVLTVAFKNDNLHKAFQTRILLGTDVTDVSLQLGGAAVTSGTTQLTANGDIVLQLTKTI